MVRYAVRCGATDGLFFYPKAVRERACEIGCEDIPYVQTWLQVLKKRAFLAVVWVIGAAVVAGIIVLIF